MARKSSSSSFAGEILHVNAVRMRVTGSGNLKLFLNSLDNVNTQQLQDIAMSSTTNKEPTQLADFQDQRIQFELKTVDINAKFYVTSITIFVVPVAAEYPR